MTGSGTAKAREALWADMCFNMSAAAWMGFSQILFMLIACPQSLQVITVLPVIFLVVVYIPRYYASLPSSAGRDGPTTNERRYSVCRVSLLSIEPIPYFSEGVIPL